MKLLKLLNRYNQEVIFEGNFESIKDLVLAAIKAKKDLSDADLRGANLRYADLRDANLSDADLRGANLRGANLSDADLSDADLRDANLRGANLSDADLSYADLRDANLSYADLRDADLRDANLSYADLRGANLRGANLSDADLRYADLRYADLSGAEKLFNTIDWLIENGEKHKEGLVFYKTFGYYKSPNKYWKIKRGAILTENVNFTKTQHCGSGINVANLIWVMKHGEGRTRDIWKVLIKWEWLAGVCVPYNTDGKIRCERVKLLSKVKK